VRALLVANPRSRRGAQFADAAARVNGVYYACEASIGISSRVARLSNLDDKQV